MQTVAKEHHWKQAQSLMQLAIQHFTTNKRKNTRISPRSTADPSTANGRDNRRSELTTHHLALFVLLEMATYEKGHLIVFQQWYNAASRGTEMTLTCIHMPAVSVPMPPVPKKTVVMDLFMSSSFRT